MCYVTAAKQLATKQGVALDMPAGPPRVLVYAEREIRCHPRVVGCRATCFPRAHGGQSSVIGQFSFSRCAHPGEICKKGKQIYEPSIGKSSPAKNC